jgi:hypothetical protein
MRVMKPSFARYLFGGLCVYGFIFRHHTSERAAHTSVGATSGYQETGSARRDR